MAGIGRCWDGGYRQVLGWRVGRWSRGGGGTVRLRFVIGE